MFLQRSLSAENHSFLLFCNISLLHTQLIGRPVPPQTLPHPQYCEGTFREPHRSSVPFRPSVPPPPFIQVQHSGPEPPEKRPLDDFIRGLDSLCRASPARCPFALCGSFRVSSLTQSTAHFFPLACVRRSKRHLDSPGPLVRVIRQQCAVANTPSSHRPRRASLCARFIGVLLLHTRSRPACLLISRWACLRGSTVRDLLFCFLALFECTCRAE